MVSLGYNSIVGFPCVLVDCGSSARRIELHIKSNGDDTYSLLCFSGLSTFQPAKQKLQGPYHRQQQAVASARAIITCLFEQGFVVVTEPVIWSLLAQQLANQQSAWHRQHQGKDDFDPNDVYFE